jgi:hypothetical protein
VIHAACGCCYRARTTRSDYPSLRQRRRHAVACLTFGIVGIASSGKSSAILIGSVMALFFLYLSWQVSPTNIRRRVKRKPIREH